MGIFEDLCAEFNATCSKMISGAGGGDVSECAQKLFEAVKRRHDAGAGGAFVCKARSAAIDAIIRRLCSIFIQRRAKLDFLVGDKFCIVALGGYGRGELAPKSDIDIMFLYKNSVQADFKTLLVDNIMYPLWNTHIALGHSSRTLQEALEAAKADILERNSMLDARLICGSEKIFATFQRSINALCRYERDIHVAELLRLKRDRHAKYGWSPYLQEPNIKNGIGGLRDSQMLGWKARLMFGSSDFGMLVRRGMLSLREYKALLRATNFLKRVRNEIHFHTGRPTDILDLELQPVIAKNLGFNQRDVTERVEAFMREVYFCFRTIDTTAKSVRKRMGISLPGDVALSMRQFLKPRVSKKKIYFDGFIIFNGEINAQRASVFLSDPARLIKLFSYVQEYGAVPSDRLEILMRDSLNLIDDSVRADPVANEAFLSILQRRGKVAPVLELMHFWGVLGAFVPEFGDITCFVQHEFYHRYTADVHTLNTIAVVDKVFRAKSGDEPYWSYHTALMSVRYPAQLIYLIMFLHDIGKGDGIKGHAQVGAEIGEKLLRRFGVRESDIEPILFTVLYHLEMARFWQSHDIEDEKAVEKFLSIIPSEEHLKFLYVATFCDAMGTSESFWNSYKQSLHSMLYGASLRKIRKGKSAQTELLLERKAKFTAELLAMEDLAESNQFTLERIESLPQNYFLFHGVSDLAMHVGMVGRLFRKKRTVKEGEGVPPIIKWIEDPEQSIVRLYVVSTDARGLFSLLAGVITIYGMNILSSKVMTCSDGVTIDTFYLTGVAGVAKNKTLRARFAAEVLSFYADREKLKSLIDEIFYANLPAKKAGSDIFIRRENGKIILEIASPDRDGLLCKLSNSINECGYDISFARVNTEGGWAFDSFHIEPSCDAVPAAELVKKIRTMLKSKRVKD